MNQDDHANRNTELLFRLDEKVVEVLRRMGEQDKEISEFRSASNNAHVTFDARISALENFRWWFLGVAAAVGVLSSYLKEWVVKGFK